MKLVPDQRRVVVGVDGSPNSIAALHRAAREARDRHARLLVLRVLRPGDSSAPRLFRTAKEWKHLRTLVAAEVPRSQHPTTTLRIVYGEPGEVLAKASEHAELLVVGARLHSEYGNPLGGDTVPVVREKARCQLVICADQRIGQESH
ncbi:universal stress protein [Actinomadura fibrosa]|uniref:Universal stress protein n=1 Tax=Actinomadura fibrosa TaxID=111802 RepID=A0ABW2XVW3_9ACTN|nr:universal stress protein [Actinomadura fibrosa]